MPLPYRFTHEARNAGGLDGVGNPLYIFDMNPHKAGFTVDTHLSTDLSIEIAYEGRVDDRTLRARTRNPFYAWWWVLHGQADIQHGSEHWRVKERHWVLIPPHFDRVHSIQPKTELVSFSFNWSWALSYSVLEIDSPMIVPVSEERSLCLHARRAVRLLDVPRSSPPRAPVRQRRLPVTRWEAFQSSLHGFLARLCDAVTRRGGTITNPQLSDSRLEYVLSDLTAHPRIGPMPYERWRSVVGLGRAQIDRLARTHLGINLTDWRNRRLAREIRRRLISGSTSIKTVAADLGFTDSAHFHRWVRRHLGVIPSQLRMSTV